MYAFARKLSPRTQYRLLRNEQVNQSATLADTFPTVKALQVNVEFFDSTGTTRTGGMKYKVNLAHGKSHFCFNCVHDNCVGGDYDLTKELANAISGKVKVAEGEMRCAGTRHHRERKEQKPCQGILRYKLTLGY
jgi:hypothetical protein